MSYLKVKTRGNSNPNGKPRVYFTCHPKDFHYFDEICESILKASDCAIYYTEDMTAPLPEEYRATDLGRMNLFVMPITFRLLTEPNRAMDSDFAFANEDHIAVLPLMMETGIDVFYEKHFGKRQYLSPFSHDLTEVGYEEKLNKFLSALLFDDKTAERVRKAFDAYIFLSYRKKDRHHANELMGLIHKNPEYRDVAIWYDEFLTPSEDFDENIRKALEKSDLFTLLVTPNLVNEENYVQTTEYPQARAAGKTVLPAEMVETSREELEKQYKELPACVHAHVPTDLDGGIKEALKNIALKANDNDPEHNYLIGLAYLEGIDVEINADYAVELITRAAESDLFEAMKKLYDIYRNGTKVEVDYNKALHWAERLAEYCKKTLGEKHPVTLGSLNDLAVSYGDVGNYQKALKLGETVYVLYCKVLGEKHPSTLSSLNNLAVSYSDVGDYQKALELNEKVYALRCEVLGAKHHDALLSLNNLTNLYSYVGAYQKALGLKEMVYALYCEVLGEKHPDTLGSLNNLANSYGDVGEHQKALELSEKVYTLSCEVLGEKHPDTLSSLHNLAVSYGNVGEHQKALELHEKVYALRCEALGEKHPDTLSSLHNLAVSYGNVGEHQKALELKEKAYALYCEVLGEKHPDTLSSLNNLAVSYGNVGDYQKALELGEKVYALRCEVIGANHPDTLKSLKFLGNISHEIYWKALKEKDPDALDSLHNLAVLYSESGEYQKALELSEKVYALRREVIGEKDADTLTTLSNLAAFYNLVGDYQKAIELGEKVYTLRCEMLGEKHPDTVDSLYNLAVAYNDVGDHQKAVELGEKVYALRCEVLGEKHPDTLRSLGVLAVSYVDVGNYQKALELSEKVYGLMCEVLGEKHPDTSSSLELLKFLQNKLGNE